MNLLVVDAVTKSFGGIRALDRCSLTVGDGTITALIGPNGSGKTTLFNVVTGYVRQDSGHVWMNGRCLDGASPGRVFAAGVARTFQLPRVFPRLTVEENMRLVASAKHSAANWPAARPGLAEDEDLLEFVGLAGHSQAAAGTLSYGQRKLLELACILSTRPEIILLDEPAGGVNPSLLLLLADRIRAIRAAGTAVLVVEHDMDFVMSLCDQVVAMSAGRVIAEGTPEEIRSDIRVVDAYLGEDAADG